MFASDLYGGAKTAVDRTYREEFGEGKSRETTSNLLRVMAGSLTPPTVSLSFGAFESIPPVQLVPYAG